MGVPQMMGFYDTNDEFDARNDGFDTENGGFCTKAEEEAARSEAERATKVSTERAAVHGYLTGLLWVLELYHHGHCLDFGYIFQRRAWEGGASPRMILEHAPTLASPGSSGGDDGLRLQAPRSDQPPLCPLACAVALLPADAAAEHLMQAGGLHPLAPLFCEDHPVLGSVVRLERCKECERLKSAYAALNREFQEARKELNDATADGAPAPQQPTRFAFGSAGVAAAAATVTEAEVADLKSRANAASNTLAEHRDTEHAGADMDNKDPRQLDEAVAAVWADLPAAQRPQSLQFAAPTRIENRGMGGGQGEQHGGRQWQPDQHQHQQQYQHHQHHQHQQQQQQHQHQHQPPQQQHPRGKRACRKEEKEQRKRGAAEAAVGGNGAGAQPTAQQRALVEQQSQLEAAILTLGPAQVAALPPDQAAVYWRLKGAR